MKIALVCDDLVQFGGQERLVLALTEVFPEAPLYASVISREWQQRLADRGIIYVSSFMNRLPFVEKLNRLYAPLLAHIFAFESFDFSDFDVVLSVSSRFAHHIVTNPGTKHICYMNSPGRMFWNPTAYFSAEFGGSATIRDLAFKVLGPMLSHLRVADYVAAQRVDTFIANSETVRGRIRKFYGRDSTVIHPFVDTAKFGLGVGSAEVGAGAGTGAGVEAEAGSIKGVSPSGAAPGVPERVVEKVVGEVPTKSAYFLVISRLVSWKKIDIVIEACAKVGVPLKIVGSGPDRSRLERLAQQVSASVVFLGYVSDKEKVKLLSECRALIHPQFEDFGITPLEAMACGKPVIAYGRGGALETVIQGVTGGFFAEQTPVALAEVLREFDETNYQPKDCRNQAMKFDVSVFKGKIVRILESLV